MTAMTGYDSDSDGIYQGVDVTWSGKYCVHFWSSAFLRIPSLVPLILRSSASPSIYPGQWLRIPLFSDAPSSVLRPLYNSSIRFIDNSQVIVGTPLVAQQSFGNFEPTWIV